MFKVPVLDTRRFVTHADTLTGRVSSGQLPALADGLFADKGHLDWRLSGWVDERGRYFIEIALTGEVWLTCRRCLTGYCFALDSVSRIHLVSSETDLPDLEDEANDSETLVMTDQILVADWVSEEALLALPLAPAHPEGFCQAQGQAAEKAATSPHPFAGLGALRRKE